MKSALTRIYLALSAMTTLWAVMAFSARPGEGTLIIDISHYVNNAVMALDTATYTNELGQQFTVSKFKYYVGDITLNGIDGKIVTRKSAYYLVDEEHPDSRRIVWDELPVGTYSSFSFILGVDSLHNTTGLQTGALDPVNAMFWTWNTGYVFLKFEGKAPLSKSPGHIIEYHIGGYKPPANSVRIITVDLPRPMTIKENDQRTLRLKADAAELFTTPMDIDFSMLSSVTDAHNAPVIADNYKDMFSVISME